VLVLAGEEIRRTDQEAAIPWTACSPHWRIGQRACAHRGAWTFAYHLFRGADCRGLGRPETGQVKLLHYTTAHDVGQIVNPIGHQGQIDGSIMQGVGYGLMEELQVEDGRAINLSFGDYKLPTMRDVPPLTTVLVESGNGSAPIKSKALGRAHSHRWRRRLPMRWQTPSGFAFATCR